MKRKGNEYDVFVKTILYDSARQKTGETWTARTNGKATTEWEMAVALTQDLTRMGVVWEIRDRDGMVKASYLKEKDCATYINSL